MKNESEARSEGRKIERRTRKRTRRKIERRTRKRRRNIRKINRRKALARGGEHLASFAMQTNSSNNRYRPSSVMCSPNVQQEFQAYLIEVKKVNPEMMRYVSS